MTELVPPEQSGADAVEGEQDLPWQRLDKRMLLVHPVNELVKLLPVVLISLIVGTQSGNHFWGLIPLGIIVAFALLRWFTTYYRIGPVHIELRTGLFQKKLLSVPRSRIRSVDVEANVLHRLLGLSVVRIGTGHQTGRDDEKFELNALDASLIPGMRAALMTKQAEPDAPVDAPESVEISHFSPGWVRYAPFSSTGVVAIAALVGVSFQYGLGEQVADSSVVSTALDSATAVGVFIAVVVGLIGLLILASVVACVRYLVTYGNLRVTDDGKVLHVSHGLLKTRQTSLDRARLRGTTLKEPLLLRLAGGAKVNAIMTGVSAESGSQSLVLPQAPVADAHRVMNTVTGDLRPVAVPLVGHGPAATRRRYTRAVLPVALLVAVAVVLRLLGVPIPMLVWVALLVLAVGAVVLGWDRARGLGHAVLPGWLISRSGSLDRDRECLQANGIIGWTVKQSYFQRRAGVCTVVAATPAGKQGYWVLDLPIEQAWPLVESVTPGAGSIWTRNVETDRALPG